MLSLQIKHSKKVRALCLYLITFVCFGTFAQPDPCGCPEGEIYVPPGPIEDYSPCDPFNLLDYCQPDTSDIPISNEVYILVLLGMGYFGFKAYKSYKADVYKSK
ncbi:MAG TPA: hypothetical protein VL947_08815 [Cytophagales bacterium]|nr:hypothetical protein [Cytophagales bacterium]